MLKKNLRIKTKADILHARTRTHPTEVSPTAFRIASSATRLACATIAVTEPSFCSSGYLAGKRGYQAHH